MPSVESAFECFNKLISILGSENLRKSGSDYLGVHPALLKALGGSGYEPFNLFRFK